MEVLDDGRWKLDSAFEARVIGRMATFGDPNEANAYIFKHSGEAEPTGDERQYFERDIEHGPIVVSKHLSHAAWDGLQSIVETGETYHGISANMATVFMGAIQRSINNRASALAEVLELPEAGPKVISPELQHPTAA